MVDEYNRRVANQGLSAEEMYAVQADILGPNSEKLQSMKGLFDVVVVRSVTKSELYQMADFILVRCLIPPP